MAASEPLQLDPSRSNFIALFGRKGSGKSTLARLFWDSWPYDRFVVDHTGDVGPAEDVRTVREIPDRWPTPPEGGRVSLRWVPDPSSATYEDDLDRAVGAAYTQGRVLLWLDEVGEHARAGRIGPHFRRALHQGRHRNLSLLMCGPRPIDLNPMVTSQADYLGVFSMPNPRDRARIADNTGFDLAEFDLEHDELVQHGFLWIDQRAPLDERMTVCSPLPQRRRTRR